MRCLLFSSNEEMVQPIWQVLTDLGIEGEYCKNAVDAVERVTTQLFQIVITDWEDQPEATFLLKTARDLKAAQRPLTLAIVGEDARPQALQAGANSILLKPLRAEQVRDTMSTACELLRAKIQAAAPGASRIVPEAAAMAASASPANISVPASVTQAPEKIRAGEFLQSSSSSPGGQFDTEEAHESVEVPIAEVDALTELEPTAAAVTATPAQEPIETKPEAQEPLTGWASLQARLTKSAPQAKDVATPESENLSYGDMAPPKETAAPATTAMELHKVAAKKNPQQDARSEAALFAYMAAESTDKPPAASAGAPIRGKALLFCALAVASLVVVALPGTRQGLQIFSGKAIHATARWLNPPPAALPPAVAMHDSFGQSGDEYKIPVGNIPDATTDPSQIRVVPVIDPTAKPEKSSAANGVQTQAPVNDNSAPDQSPAAPNQPPPSQAAEGQIKDPAISGSTDTMPNPVAAAPATTPLEPSQQPSSLVRVTSPPQTQVAASVRSSPSPAVPAVGSGGIPSSLRSQLASATPDASGTKPDEAAMSSIEPVKLPEATVLELLAQPVDPEYPAAAKASGQRGTVILEVLIGRDGTVQDAKFMQGSLVFARAAIDAVRQWRFKPYSMNGRAVSVQSVITLNFKPPA